MYRSDVIQKWRNATWLNNHVVYIGTTAKFQGSKRNSRPTGDSGMEGKVRRRKIVFLFYKACRLFCPSEGQIVLLTFRPLLENIINECPCYIFHKNNLILIRYNTFHFEC